MGRKRLSSSDSTAIITSEMPQRNTANARERARMRVLSKEFIKLKTHLPWVPHDTKLSKLDTLRLAKTYILHLTQILDNDEYPVQTITTPPMTIQASNNFVSEYQKSWPYSSCHRASSLCAMNGRLSSSTSSNRNNNCDSNHEYQIQSELIQENHIEEKSRVY